MFNHNIFSPPSFHTHIISMPCWHRKCQSFQRWHIKKKLFEVTALHVTPRICANPSWTYLPKIHHKTSDPKVSSHTSVLNFAGTALHVTPRMCANPSWTNVPKTHDKTSNPKMFISHIPVWTFPEQLSILRHACVPTLNQRSKDKPQNLRPWDFHLTHPCFELCRSSSPYYATHLCQPWTNVPKINHKTSDPKIFISHIPVLNFAGSARHVTPRMCANPSCTNVSRYTTKD